MSAATQEIIALGIVAAAVLLQLFAWYKRRNKHGNGCDSCDSGKSRAKPKESPLKFYKRRQ